MLQARTNAWRCVGTKKKRASRSSCVESVEFYTGIPSLLRFTFLLNTLLPYTENMEYWDRKKSPHHITEKTFNRKKPGQKRVFQAKEEFLPMLLRLKWRLMELLRSLPDSGLDVQVIGVSLNRVGFLTKEEVKLNIPPFSKGKYKEWKFIFYCKQR